MHEGPPSTNPYEYARQPGIGRVFEQAVGATGDITRVSPRSGHVVPLLGTIERADIESLATDVELDGYIYGVGTGMIFASSLLYRAAEHQPAALLACDTDARAVLTGRVTATLMRWTQTYDQFLAGVRNQTVFRSALEEVIALESQSRVRNIFHDVSKDGRAFFDEVQRSMVIEQPGDHGYLKRYGGGSGEAISVLGAIREGWGILKPLADENNMGFALASFYDPAAITAVSQMPGFTERRNLIYGSNLPDYAVALGGYHHMLGRKLKETESMNWASFVYNLEALNTTNNTFLIASVDNGMRLQAFQGLPSERPVGFL